MFAPRLLASVTQFRRVSASTVPSGQTPGGVCHSRRTVNPAMALALGSGGTCPGVFNHPVEDLPGSVQRDPACLSTALGSDATFNMTKPVVLHL
jgi:hypothetical protein